MSKYYLLVSLVLFTHSAIAQVLLFEDNFDTQADWQTQDENNMGSIPTGWDTGRTDENWHPSNTPGSSPSMLISGDNPEQVYGGTGKAFITYSESFNDLSNNGYTSDGFITKDIPPTDELYVQFQIKFQPGFAADTEGGSIKVFRVLSWDGVEPRHRFFSSGNSAPIYVFDWSQNSYGVRQFHAFRCDDQSNNYYCTNPTISGAPRSIVTGDMSANFVEDIDQFPNTIPDLVNGGTIPTSGTITHNQVYGSIWHKMAFYLRMNTAPGVKDGILRAWIDDQPITDINGIAWIGTNGSMSSQWNSISFGGNDRYHFNTDSAAPIADRERWYAIDEIKVFDSIPTIISPPTPPVLLP